MKKAILALAFAGALLISGCARRSSPQHLLRIIATTSDVARDGSTYETVSLHSEAYNLNYEATLIGCVVNDPIMPNREFALTSSQCPTPPSGYYVLTYDTETMYGYATRFRYTLQDGERATISEFDVYPVIY